MPGSRRRTRAKKKKIGGGTTTTTTYTYVKEWTPRPPDSSAFKDPGARSKGYVNPPQAVQAQSWSAEKAEVGPYAFNPREASMPSSEPLPLTAEMIRSAEMPPEQGAVVTPAARPTLEGNTLYAGRGTPARPQVGDVRISYSVLRPGAKVTIFGRLNGTTLEAYVHKTGDRLFRVLSGTRDEAIARLAFEHKAIGWSLRLVGFLLMWIGLCLFFGPINAVLDVLPFLGSAGRTIVGLVMFPVALVLTLVTIVVAKIGHSPVALVLTLVVIVGGAILWSRRKAAARAKTAVS